MKSIVINQLIKRSFIKEISWVFVEQIGLIVGGFIGIKLLTHFLTPSEYGYLSLSNTIIFFITTTLFVFNQAFLRFWSICKDRGDINAFYYVVENYRKSGLIMTIIVSLSGFILLRFLKVKYWDSLFIISSLIGGASGLLESRASIFTAARKRKISAFLKGGNAILKPIVAVFFVLFIVSKTNYALLGYLFSTLFFLILAEYVYNKSIYNSFSGFFSVRGFPLLKGVGKEIILYSWPYLVWAPFNWVYLSSDRWALQAFHGTQIVGGYSVVSRLATLPLIFGSSFLILFFAPIAFQAAGSLSKKKSIERGYKILGIMIGIYIFIVTFLIIFYAFSHRTLILLISNYKFIRFSYLLPELTLAWSFFYLGQLLSQFGLLKNKPQEYVLPKAVSALILGLMSFYLSQKMGVEGVVKALFFSGIFYAIWCGLIALRLYKDDFE